MHIPPFSIRSLIGTAIHAALALLVLATALTFAAPATEVTSLSDSGFAIRSVATIAAPPAEVYRTLTKDIRRWWNPDHTWSGNAANLSLDDRAGGLFLEKLPNGGTCAHMTVVFASPGETLRLTGGLGPLQADGIAGSLTWSLKPESPGTQVELTYVVGGYRPGGFKELAPLVNQVLTEQLQRLKSHIESR